MSKPKLVVCNVCGSREKAVLFETRDRLLDLPGSFRYVRCPVCGLVYVDPQPSWDDREPHYALAYPGYERLETVPSWTQQVSMAFGLRKRHRIVSSHVRGGRLLDVGCAGGDFIAWMQRHGRWQVCGLERVAAIGDMGRRRYGLPTVLGDVQQAAFVSSSFDAITLWAVLEHLQDPARGLAECGRLLKERGLLVVRTVSAGSWPARLFGPNWLGYDAPRVLFAFSERALRELLSRAGFHVLDIGCYFHDFYPYAWSLRNLCRTHVRNPALREVVDAVAGSSIARLLTYPLFALQTRLGGNSFVTAVARKT